ncbi:glycoside hydrolase family 3 N-terminal domain-containing protein [Streptosporangium sp. NPDC004379]|uniref:glycoside hydrolase family 3 N-terminal domain-containing protein n=1 Tax=Streptosporangium sp. NPDC004379 TaxID=3366189 RepID=UPI003686250C
MRTSLPPGRRARLRAGLTAALLAAGMSIPAATTTAGAASGPGTATGATTVAGAGTPAMAGPGAGLRAAAGEPYRDPSLPVATRVADLLSRMTLDEKIGQMTQAERASVTAADITAYRLGSLLSGGGSAPSPNNAASWADMYDGFQRAALATPLGVPLVYGADAVHGHNNVVGATIFPHNIGLGATRDPELVRQIGRAVAEEVSGTGVDWDFAPCVCVARDDRWGRTYESFGEVPELPASMTTIVTGLQGSQLGGPASVMATAKHYVGDGGTAGGDDQGDARLTEAELRAVHLPPFKAAVDRGVGSVMVSYSSWNGVKTHGDRYLITSVLKGELGFTGIVVSDWNGVDQIDGAEGLSATDVRTAVNAGVDMVMEPQAWKQFITLLRAEVQAGRVATSRVDDAVRRILTKKFELGLFEKPLTDRSYTSTVGSAAHRALARQAVAKSQVLLKNSGNVLPLTASGGKIFVAGKSADDIGVQSGGWTVTWQGSTGNITPGTTILQGIRDTVGSAATVTYSRDGSGVDGSYRAAIAVVGETPYAEGQGDRTGSMGLDATDLRTLDTLRRAGVPLVVVLVSGRPLDIAAQLPGWDALVAAWLPGTEGRGVADVLFGAVKPTGKLPMTWMSDVSQQPINDGDGKTPLFPYGHGLTYRDTPADTAPPSAPGVPVASEVTSSQVELSWAASSDDVGVTAYDVVRVQGTTETTVATQAAPSATVTGLSAGTAYTFAVYARDAAGNRSPRSGTVNVTTRAGNGGGGCRVTYAAGDWGGGGFGATVTVANTGTSAINGWTLRFTFPGDQRVTQGWSATWSQSGADVTATSLSWNASLAPGASTGIGFNGSYGSGNPAPAAFTLNGTPCSVS